MDIKPIIEECKQVLKQHYGPNFSGLFIYGSMARGQGTKSSDLDLLVLLMKPFNYFEELRTIVDILYPIQLKSEQLISAKPVHADEFESGEIQLYRIAKREGMAA